MTRPISENKMYCSYKEEDISLFREGITKKMFWFFVFIFCILGFLFGLVLGLAHGDK